MDAVSDWAALYRDAKSTTTVAKGKLQHTNASRAKGLTTCKSCKSTNKIADWTVIRASDPAKIPGRKTNRMSCQYEAHRKPSLAGSRRANQFKTACHHSPKMGAREDHGDS